jgi:hypothetical protein
VPENKYIEVDNKNEKNYLRKGYFSVFDWTREDIGKALMNTTNHFLNKIQRKELYKAIYNKKEKNIKCPNVVECINYFNKLTLFIIEDIISYDSPADRAKVIEKWSDVAEYCMIENDFNDCIAINSAFNHFIIKRLGLTNKELSSKAKNTKNEIFKFCNLEGNFKNVREKMAKLNNDKKRFYPYLGIVLKDISFNEEGSKYLDGQNINLEKIEIINEIIEKNFKFKLYDNSNSIFKELNFFDNLEDNTEEYLERISNNIEPKFLLQSQKDIIKRATKIDEKYFTNYKSKQKDRLKFFTFL